MTLHILQGHCLDLLRAMPDEPMENRLRGTTAGLALEAAA